MTKVEQEAVDDVYKEDLKTTLKTLVTSLIIAHNDEAKKKYAIAAAQRGIELARATKQTAESLLSQSK